MSAVARVFVAITSLVSVLGILTQAVGAVTWHNTGSTAFTATAGPATLTRGGINLACSAGYGRGTAPGGTTVGSVFTVNGTATFTPCLLAGQATYTHCTVSTLTTSTQSAGVSVGGTTVTCFVRLTATNTAICAISGTTPGQYTNPSGATPGRLTGYAASTLTVSDATSACPLGTGPASITERTGTVTAGSPTTLGPVLTRTP